MRIISQSEGKSLNWKNGGMLYVNLAQYLATTPKVVKSGSL